jgi:hypothetical protein
VHPSLIACEDNSEFALEGRNLEFEAMLITIKDSDTTLAGLLVGRVCINDMSIWCLVGVSFCLIYPDIALKQTANCFINFASEYSSGNLAAYTEGAYSAYCTNHNTSSR